LRTVPLGVDGGCQEVAQHAECQLENSQSIRVRNNYFTEMCSGSEAGSHVRLIDYLRPSLALMVDARRSPGAATPSFRAFSTSPDTLTIEG